MAQAMSAFGAATAASDAGARLTAPQSAGGALASHAARMAGALQQFSLDGHTAGAPLSDHDTLRLTALQPSAAQGLLAAPR
jgi:hypothetical protein